MPSRSVSVGSSVGLHARPAAVIASAAQGLTGPVTLACRNGAPVDARSALLIMTLGAGFGERIEVAGEVAGEVDIIAALVARDLDT